MTETETTRPPREAPVMESWAAPGAGDPDAPGTVSVGASIYNHEALPVAGMTIEQVRRTFGDRLDIDPQATPVLDGAPAPDESTVLRAGQTLTFFRPSGEKGRFT
jgi:hypothetical protein